MTRRFAVMSMLATVGVVAAAVLGAGPAQATYDAAGTGQARLTTDPSREIGPVWSPDGTKIAFLRYREPTTGSVYIMNADGTDQHPVHPRGLQYVPAWQPLGQASR
jgi:Tol biopolymer transport system component